MSYNISELEPLSIWKNFTALNAIPRPSKKEEKIIEFMIEFGKRLHLDTQRDEVGNVRIIKPATAGMENHKTVCLQSHLDMVCQKNNDTSFDFETQGIQMYIDEGFVKAKGTTLGADNGIGVAAIMGVLESTDIAHPKIEALFTIDEETGMTGAKGLQPGWITADILLNLDTEEDDELDIGCAGGVDVTGNRQYTLEDTPSHYFTYQLHIKGLSGGHSGADIHKGLGNANKVLGELLSVLKGSILLHEVDGGGLRNAIPREAVAYFSSRHEDFLSAYTPLKNKIKAEFSKTDPHLEIVLTESDFREKGLNSQDSDAFIDLLNSLFNGVYVWSKDIPDLVEASNNVARVEILNGQSTVMCLTRSSVESSKMEVADLLKKELENAGYTVRFSGDYPGWEPKANSEILKVMISVYENLFSEEPKVMAIHAGLECGLIGDVYPQMDMISFGPNIFGAHSPDERAEIQSVQKFWNFLIATLAQIPSQ